MYMYIYHPYERVYLPLYKEADTPFHIQRDDIPFSAYDPRNTGFNPFISNKENRHVQSIL